MTTEMSQRVPALPLLPEHGRGREGAPRVAVWGHYYGSNLGDDLVASVVFAAVRARRPDAEVCAISLDPADTEVRHGVPAFPLVPRSPRARPVGAVRRILAGLRRRARAPLDEAIHGWRSYRTLRRLDLVVVSGSGQLLDQWNGPWGHPWTILKWAMLSRLAGTRMAMLSVGAGPLDGRLARFFVRRAVEAAAFVSVRDEGTKRVLRSAGVRRELPVCPDMAFGADVPVTPAVSEQSEDVKFTLGLNLLAHAHPEYWGRGDLGKYETYLARMTRVACAALEQGMTVRLFSSHASADERAADDLIAAVWVAEPRLAPRLVRESVHNVDELEQAIASCDMIVAARFHSVVLPLLMGIPTLAIAYHPKTVDVMDMAGQSRYCFPDIDTLDSRDVSARLRELVRDASQREKSPLASRISARP